MRIALLGPLAPWRGGLSQFLALLGESLAQRAEVRAVTFTRQYPALLFPGHSQHDPEAERPRFPVDALLDSVQPLSWRRTARRLEAFAPGAVVLKWWMPFFAPCFASSVGPLRPRGTRVVLVCDNLVPHERRPLDGTLTRWMLRNSDGYLVMSDSVERDLDRLKPGCPRRRSGPTAEAKAGAKNGIHHLRTTAPGAKRSSAPAVRRQLQGRTESSRASTGKRGRSAAGSSCERPGNSSPGYCRVKVKPRTSAWAIRDSPRSARYCASPPRHGARGPSSAIRIRRSTRVPYRVGDDQVASPRGSNWNGTTWAPCFSSAAATRCLRSKRVSSMK